MTGKIQKQENDSEALMKACSLSLEDRARIIDEALCEVHAQNADFLEKFSMPITSFRGMYQVHILFNRIDELIFEKCKEETAKRAEAFRKELELKKRR